MAKKKRSGFGDTADQHASHAQHWLESAEAIIRTADQISSGPRPCQAIEHYTDAVAEGTVAEVQAAQAGRQTIAGDAARLVRDALRKQRHAVVRCRVQKQR